MIQFRLSEDRGHANHGWLDSYHTFSFADYYDRAFMGFRTLRVINEDRIDGGQGFGTHAHKDMEIITYIVGGELQHKDSMGTTSVITPGEVQYMCAGSGVRHSEFNPSPVNACHLLQIWMLPDAADYPPAYDQRSFTTALDAQDKVLVISRDGRDNSIKIHQDADLWVSRLKADRSLDFELGLGRHAWIQMVRGEILLNGTEMQAGDGAAVTQELKLNFKALKEGAEFLIFDLP